MKLMVVVLSMTLRANRLTVRQDMRRILTSLEPGRQHQLLIKEGAKQMLKHSAVCLMLHFRVLILIQFAALARHMG